MNRKRMAILVSILLCAVCLGACAPAAQITTTSGGTYDIQSVKTATEFGDTVASEGQTYLLVNVKGQSSQMDDMQNMFFGIGQDNSQISDGITIIPCTAVFYSSSKTGNDPSVVATLLFEIPKDFAKTVTFSGQMFDPVTLKL